jgi:hypothetical protein
MGGELFTLVVAGAMEVLLLALALMTLDADTIRGALVFLALPAALYLGWLGWFAVRWSRRG